MPSEDVIVEFSVRSAGPRMEEVADLVMSLLETGAIQMVDFGEEDDPSLVRAVGYAPEDAG
ncbi:hypothetical protein [Microbispora sp. ATCC PTA-5024]|uniref:hypothetical protein n=1 Tax=Microbispora sp. ATCC PTA-5024 TaxID=316330 RepID=UPI0003DC685E|nr:hypothetical protein [Microbispora sp. ATCC PTA-5024]ETK36712.1 hypothetical protein MPTA5024_07515 [Microbispora sp. ATCC PTA-5024]